MMDREALIREHRRDAQEDQEGADVMDLEARVRLFARDKER